MMLKSIALSLAVFLAVILTACSGTPSSSHVILETDLGNIEIELYADKAPLSSADFLYYVDESLYNGHGFYRAVRPETDPREMGMQVIQGGRLELAPVTATIAHEPTSQTGLSHTDGAVSLARDEVGTASAAFFFISIGENKFLDYGGARNPDGQGYAVFGQVVSGMEVVRAIQARETKGLAAAPDLADQYLTAPVIINQARRK